MHIAEQNLLNFRQFDILLITALTLHAGRDTTNDNNGISLLDLVGQVGEVSELTLTDVATQHSEVAVATLVLNHNVILFTLFDIE